MIPSVPPSRPAHPPVITVKAPAGLASLEPVAATKAPPAQPSRGPEAEATRTAWHASAAPGRTRLLAWGGAAACVALVGAAVAGTVGGVGSYVAPPAVVRCQVEDDVTAGRSFTGKIYVPEIAFQELDIRFHGCQI